MISLRFAWAIALVAACSLVVANAMPVAMPCPITNVCFVIDQSGSINSIEYGQEQTFVIKIATEIKMVTSDAKLSAVAFASTAQQIQAPTASLTAFSQSVNGPRVVSGGTAMAAGLSACFAPLAPLSGNRIIVLVTDGNPNSASATEAVATDIRNEDGVFLVTVAIGMGGSGADFLKTIAHTPDFALESTFTELPEMVKNVVEKVCTVVDDSPADCEKAYADCMFKFDGESGLTKYNIMPNNPDKAFTPIIVPKDPMTRVVVLNTNGIVPEFITATGAKPITDFGSQSFTPTHFKPFWINMKFGSGIGHQTFQGNQAMVAEDKCVRVFFTSFQLLENRNGNNVVVDNRNNVPRSENKCVVFET